MLIAIALTAAALSPRPASSITPASAPSPTAQADPAQRYCIEATPTGTRIPRRDCRTRADWLRDGFDPVQR